LHLSTRQQLTRHHLRSIEMPRALRTAFVGLSVLLFAHALCSPAARAQSAAPFRAPESIRSGLAILNQVVIDSGRLIAAGSFEQLPRQSDQFESGATALEQGLGDSHSQFRRDVERVLARARIASGAMSDAATAHRTAMLPAAHQQLADAVRALDALFPPEVRP
jgi:hypothetical protein